MTPVLLLSSASFAVLGAALTLPGALLPLLVERFGLRLVEAGSMLALQPVAYLLSVLAAGRIIARLGMRGALAASLLTLGAGIAGFGLASSWRGGGATLFVSGLGIGVMEVAANTLLVTAGGPRRSNLLNFAHIFFGLGSFVAPALSTHAVAAGVSWRIPFLVAGGMIALVGVGWRVAEVAVAAPAPSSSDDGRLHRRLAGLLAVLLGVYVGAETGIGAWLTNYMVGARHATLPYAGNVLSLYWLGLAAGRLVLSVLAHHAREERLILALAAVSGVTLAAALVVADPALAAAAFAATGASFSGIFPAVIALGGRYHPHSTARVTSILVAGAGVGGITIPWTMSAIADGGRLVAGMGFYLAMTAVMMALAAVVSRSLPARIPVP